MTDINDIIHRLQDEIIFLQSLPDTTKMDNYNYRLKGDLSESRNF